MHRVDRLVDPFRRDVLPHLSASALACLRSTCRDFKRLVDEETGSIWRSAAASLLQAETLPYSSCGAAVQTRLQQHADVLKSLASGEGFTL